MLTPESFERLLAWLDPDSEKAAHAYLRLQAGLIRIFAHRGCNEPEHLADDTIDRVAAKIDWLINNYIGEPQRYFYGVARNVCHEYERQQFARLPLLVTETVDSEEIEKEYECLDQCIEELSAIERQIVLDYHEQEKHQRITNRKRIATELGISLNALRIRMHRIHMRLKGCFELCLENAPAH